MTVRSDFLLQRTGFNDVYDYLEDGTYTPTLTNSINVASSTAYECQYLRIGTVVTVSGRVDIDPTSASVNTQLLMSLPIASNFANANELGGSGGEVGKNVCLRILADATNKGVQIDYYPLSAANTPFSFTFTYQII